MNRSSTLILSFGLISAALLTALFLTVPWRAGAGPILTVTFTAVDMDPTGNTCGSIGNDVQQTLGSVPLNTPTVINVVVDGVPAGPGGADGTGGIYGTGFELNYDPAIVRVTAGSGGANNVLHLCSGSGYVPLEITDGVPDTDGSFRFDSVDLSGVEEDGAGRLASITVECVATGVSLLALTDTSTGGDQFAGVLGDSGGITYVPEEEREGAIGCGTPVPADATLRVSKNFTPDSGASVTVSVTCTGGAVASPLSAPASEASPAVFTISGEAPGVECTATETTPTGYTANQSACASVQVTVAAPHNCTITNTLNPITFTVNKDFVGADNASTLTATLTCTSGTVTPPGSSNVGTGSFSEASPIAFTVANFNTGATCTATESAPPSGFVPDESDCASVPLTPGTNESCLIENLTQAFVNVSKDFSDNNQMDVNIVVDCDSGTDLEVDGTANEGPTPAADAANWEIRGFTEGATCTVQENPEPAGYQFSINDCGGIVINAGSVVDCTVVNLTERFVLVRKDFSDDNASDVTASLNCVGDPPITTIKGTASEAAPAEFRVLGFTPGTTCTATESGVPAGYVPDESDCATITLTVGDTVLECTMVNDAQSTITVTKTYGNSIFDPVNVTVGCSAGVVTPAATQQVSPGPGTVFTVTGHDDATSCTLTESSVPAGFSMNPDLSTCDEGITLNAPSSQSCGFHNDPSQTTFTVLKDYIPDIVGSPVTIQLLCTGAGSVTPVDTQASEGDPATFTVTAFSQGDTCTATETGEPAGFAKDETNCAGVTLVQGSTSCTITNTSETTVTIAKNFIPDNDGVSVTLHLNCPSGIVTPASDTATETPVPDNAVFTVRGFVDDTTCTVTEDPIPGWIFGTGDCPGEPLILNYGDVNFCTVTNTETSGTATISKFYTDANTTDVTITPTCPGANVSPPSALAGPIAGSPVFTITRFPVPGGTLCTFVESGVPSGYAMDPDASSCDEGLTIQNGINAACHFTNEPSSGTLRVTKDFVPDTLDTASVTINCTDGTVSGGSSQSLAEGNNDFTVTAFNPGDTCSVTEDILPSGYEETSNDCSDVALVNDDIATCSIVNSTAVNVTVNKDFLPDHNQQVTISILGCSSGTVEVIDATAVETTDPADFRLVGFSDGATCSISETIPQGYIFDPGDCDEALNNITVGVDINCTVTNTLRVATMTLPVDFNNDAALDATVGVSCSSGTVTNFDNGASEGDPANFTLEGFDDDASCSFTWTPPSGYHMGDHCISQGSINHGDSIIACELSGPSQVILNIANFTVNKNFTDDATDAVTIALNCTSGSEVTIDDQASEGDPASFRVEGFTHPGTTCTATESGVPVGYFPDESDCLNVPISIDGNHSCEILNSDVTPTPSASPSPTASPTPTPTPTPAPTGSPSPAPSPTPTPTPAPTAGPSPTPSPTPTPTPGDGLLWADADCDGVVNPVDALKGLRHDAGLNVDQRPGCPPIAQTVDIEGILRKWLDANCDDDVNPLDSLAILRFDAGLSVNQAPGCPAIGEEVLGG